MPEFGVQPRNPQARWNVVGVRGGECLELLQGGFVRARICQSFRFGALVGDLLRGASSVSPRIAVEMKIMGANRPSGGLLRIGQARVIRSTAEGTTFFGRASSHFSDSSERVLQGSAGPRHRGFRLAKSAGLAGFNLFGVIYERIERRRAGRGVGRGRRHRCRILTARSRASCGTRAPRAGDPRRSRQPDWRQHPGRRRSRREDQ